MQIFYAPNIDSQQYTLPEDESKHCIRVLRLKLGDRILLTDGKGSMHKAQIASDNPKRCLVNIIETQHNFGQRPFYLHIAIAPTKNMERLEWFIEKATEIGIDEITPLLCERSEKKTVNAERLERIAVSAMKQSVKAYLPRINDMVAINQFVLRSSTEETKLIAHCNRWNLPPMQELVQKGKSILVLIGPEGDFSPNEVELCIANGFHEASLSSSRLRTETAGIVACQTANLLNKV